MERNATSATASGHSGRCSQSSLLVSLVMLLGPHSVMTHELRRILAASGSSLSREPHAVVPAFGVFHHVADDAEPVVVQKSTIFVAVQACVVERLPSVAAHLPPGRWAAWAPPG